jgi:hypothetical protein
MGREGGVKSVSRTVNPEWNKMEEELATFFFFPFDGFNGNLKRSNKDISR